MLRAGAPNPGMRGSVQSWTVHLKPSQSFIAELLHSKPDLFPDPGETQPVADLDSLREQLLRVPTCLYLDRSILAAKEWVASSWWQARRYLKHRRDLDLGIGFQEVFHNSEGLGSTGQHRPQDQEPEIERCDRDSRYALYEFMYQAHKEIAATCGDLIRNRLRLKELRRQSGRDLGPVPGAHEQHLTDSVPLTAPSLGQLELTAPSLEASLTVPTLRSMQTVPSGPALNADSAT